MIADIAVEGNQKTSEHLVREQFELSTTQPLDLSALARSRRNLYDTGAFSIVDITREDLEGDAPAPADSAPGPPTGQADDQKPVRVNVSVREVQPFQLRYGASYDTERGVGGIFDVSNHNSLGKARVIGLQSRYDRQLREARLYISQPSLRYWPLKTTGSLYFREELNPPTELTDAFDVSRRGASIQQELELRDAYVWSYGYRYERARTLEPSAGRSPCETLTVSPLTSTLTRETRDEVLDASTGRVPVAGICLLTGLARIGPALSEVLRAVLPLLPAAGAAAEAVHERDPPAAARLSPPACASALAHGLGGAVPPERALLRRRQHDAARLRPECRRPDRPGPRARPAATAVFVINNELRVPLVEHRRRRGVRGCRQRLRQGQRLLVHRPARVGRRWVSACARPGSCCAATTGSCSIAAPASGGAASISASGRRSDTNGGLTIALPRKFVIRCGDPSQAWTPRR